MSFPVLPTPKPYENKVLGNLPDSHSLTTLLLNHQSSTVTPDYPQREKIFFRPSESEGHQVSIDVASEALAMVQQSLSNSQSSIRALAPRPVKLGSVQKGLPPPLPFIMEQNNHKPFRPVGGSQRLNKFVRRLHDMLQGEMDSGVVEWRRGLLVLYSTDAFAKKLLPKYFATKNFKTFRRQLNYYGFVHVRSFNTTGGSPTALWVNRELANEPNDDISSVLKLKRVEPCETAKTTEGRRQRKELAKHTVEQDIGISAKCLQQEQIRSLALRGGDILFDNVHMQCLQAPTMESTIPREVEFVTDSSSVENGGSSGNSVDDYQGESGDWETTDGASESAANVLLMLSRA